MDSGGARARIAPKLRQKLRLAIGQTNTLGYTFEHADSRSVIRFAVGWIVVVLEQELRQAPKIAPKLRLNIGQTNTLGYTFKYADSRSVIRFTIG
jgi:hypothetical protein